MKKMLTKQMLTENLAEYLPASQQRFKTTQAYLDLCDAVWDVIRAYPDDRPTKQQALQHQRGVWEHFCAFETEREEIAFERAVLEQEKRCAEIEAKRPKAPKLSDCGWGSI
jgi:hypothetical protein